MISITPDQLGWGPARARLEGSYGMTELGAQWLLEEARADGSAETLAVRVQLVTRYPEIFTLTPKQGRRKA